MSQVNDRDAIADASRLWITAVPTFEPEETWALLDIDLESADPGERMVSVLLNRGHEGEEGVFYLLPWDLSARYARDGDRLAITLTASRQVLTDDLDQHENPLREALSGLSDDVDSERVVLLRREAVTDFVPAEQDGEKQPVLIIDRVGGPAVLADLLTQLEEGEASIAVLNAE